MRINRLYISNFRNIKEADIQLGKVNIFKGANGQGKTNFLEAIFFLGTGRSSRTNKVQQMIRWGSGFFRIIAEASGMYGNYTLEARLTPAKRWKLNGVFIDGPDDPQCKPYLVLFSPDDLQIIKGSPVYRRRFLDLDISMVNLLYKKNLVDYYRLLSQRNCLLKQVSRKQDTIGFLEILDQKISTLGGKIISARFEELRQIQRNATSVYSQISGTTDTLEIHYRPGLKLKDVDLSNPLAIEKQFLTILRDNRREEISRGLTLFGPHRDDYSIFIGNMDCHSFASQGQVRTAVVSIKMAQISLLKKTTGEEPILLLDDVMSELDNMHRQNLLELNDGAQVFMTCTDLDILGKNMSALIKGNGYNVFRVKSGAVFEQT